MPPKSRCDKTRFLGMQAAECETVASLPNLEGSRQEVASLGTSNFTARNTYNSSFCVRMVKRPMPRTGMTRHMTGTRIAGR